MPGPRPPLVLDAVADPDTTVSMEEDDVPAYTLPDPLRFDDGRAVSTEAAWSSRREDLLAQFEDHVYGRTPTDHVAVSARVVEEGDALDGAARRLQHSVMLETALGVASIGLLAYRPVTAEPVPWFLVPNFGGNHTIQPDEAVIAPNDTPRGSAARRFPISEIVARGYGLATFHYEDACPDREDGLEAGVHRLFHHDAAPGPDGWGAVGAWAWANSRVLDHLETVETVDPGRVVVGGHSRIGKAALWTAAQDQRFAGVISNNSGCTGAALSRRRYGENVAVINALFPHWFCRNYRAYSANEASLPVDQHELIALVASRPACIASATEDQWADPLGEWLAAVAATPVYELLGGDGLSGEPPAPGVRVGGSISYHLRAGPHDLLAADWHHFLDFFDRHLR